MIWAQARNGVIGANGYIPWRVPGEQQIFKDRTMGAAVVMGRATWDSLPERVRPLPGRRNIVLTRDPAWTAAGAEVVHSPDDVTLDEFWVMGGAEVYRAFLGRADHIVRTTIDFDSEGDAYAPDLGPGWIVAASTGPVVAPDGQKYSVDDLVRSAGQPGDT
ncbi:MULTISPECIES: dihydrofolate reductase [Actinoplanes]|uniref:dihydrofolate reductase n=1 Tax=Actinoplanes TaxID=1865 RepID=UPI001FE0F9CA|nr:MULTISPECIES: dihydrofolate reductase [Actinoplanes]